MTIYDVGKRVVTSVSVSAVVSGFFFSGINYSEVIVSINDIGKRVTTSALLSVLVFVLFLGA